LANAIDKIVDHATGIHGRASTGLRSTQFRRQDEPLGTGLEPDCSFLIGERVYGYIAALKHGEAAAEAFILETPPDLVVEVELTHAETGKPERYGQLGVSEIWLLNANAKREIVGAEFLALHPLNAPQAIQVSRVLPGIKPAQIVKAIEGVRLAATREERWAAVEHVIGTRGAVRIEDESAAYA